MLKYLEANLHPEHLNLTTATPTAATLAAALIQSHQLRADGPSGKIALAWIFQPATGDYWHDGGTGGYSSYAFFNPKGDYAAVVLLNTTVGPNSSFADLLGQHISQRLAGKMALSLAR
jgi:CubicO group peptidase (beta-lactamase class C family)